MSSPSSVWSILRGAIRSKLGKIAALLFTVPFWKLLWNGIDALGNVRMITDNARAVLSFLASWWGALGLMGLGFVLLWREVQKQLESIKNAVPSTGLDLVPPVGDELQPEDLVSLFKSNEKLIGPYVDQVSVTKGTLREIYYKGLRENTNSVFLKRPSGINIIAHLAPEHEGRVYGLPFRSEIAITGLVASVDSTTVTLDKCEILNVRPLLEDYED